MHSHLGLAPPGWYTEPIENRLRRSGSPFQRAPFCSRGTSFPGRLAREGALLDYPSIFFMFISPGQGPPSGRWFNLAGSVACSVSSVLVLIGESSAGSRHFQTLSWKASVEGHHWPHVAMAGQGPQQDDLTANS